MILWLILPSYDFAVFRSVAVNSVYKLQFYRVMHYSAKRGLAIACRLSVRL